jgi:hypothetical protein
LALCGCDRRPLDADRGEIHAHCLTDQETGDASRLEAFPDQIDDEIGQFKADGASDGYPTYDAVLRHSAGAKGVVPALERGCAPQCPRSCQGGGHVVSMQPDGWLTWRASTRYGDRALIETAMGRNTGIIGPRLRARPFPAQQAEAAIGVTILNRMLACRRPSRFKMFKAAATACGPCSCNHRHGGPHSHGCGAFGIFSATPGDTWAQDTMSDVAHLRVLAQRVW